MFEMISLGAILIGIQNLIKVYLKIEFNHYALFSIIMSYFILILGKIITILNSYKTLQVSDLKIIGVTTAMHLIILSIFFAKRFFKSKLIHLLYPITPLFVGIYAMIYMNYFNLVLLHLIIYPYFLIGSLFEKPKINKHLIVSFISYIIFYLIFYFSKYNTTQSYVVIYSGINVFGTIALIKGLYDELKQIE